MTTQILCRKCEHPINKHTNDGCQHIERPGNYDMVCNCYDSPNEVAAAELAAKDEKIAQLTEALKEIANSNKHLDNERMEETHGRVAMLMRLIAAGALVSK